jgi:3-oxoacyl-[acyl-carrier protein] reductase
MNIRFDKKTVVIGGARWGIGRRIAEMFLDGGGRVYCCDNEASGLEYLDGLGAVTRVLDLTDTQATEDWVKAIESETGGSVDVLVNNAGGLGPSRPGEFLDVADDVWDRTLLINTRTTLALSRAVVRGMQAAGQGRIVNISSGAGIAASGTRNHAYTAAKHAVVGLTRQMAYGLGKHGITVNAVAPGFVISTPETQAVWANQSEAQHALHLENVYMRRVGHVDDIAAATLFLASREASWISGQVLSVNGGRAA